MGFFMDLRQAKRLILEGDTIRVKTTSRFSHGLWYAINFFLSMAAAVYYVNKSSRLKQRFLSVYSTITLRRFIRYCQRQAPRALPIVPADQAIVVSIIVPVYNQWHLTQACLNSILFTCGPDITYEVILADDCSTDDTLTAASVYSGLQITRTASNVGFLRNCNHAAKSARGRYILLLNNDTIVLPGWLHGLCHTLDNDPTVAIAGSKIVYAHGNIQEAGAVIFRDGSDCHIGRGRARDTPVFNIPREVDCITGCSIIIRKSFWDSVGGFDVRYQNAYFEEYDLMMTARQQGLRVMYQPASEVVHFEHQSYVKETKLHPLRSLSEHNKQIFLKKWHDTLCQHHYARLPEHLAMASTERTAPYSYQERYNTTKRHILFYSPNPLYPQNHGNRTRMQRLIEQFQALGHRVHVAILNDVKLRYDDLEKTRQQLNVTVDVIASERFRVSPGFVPYDGWFEPIMGESVRALCEKYQIDVVVCSYIYQSKLLEYVPQYVLKVIDTHDKMADRTTMLRANHLPIGQFSCSLADEAAYLRRADVVIGITDDESDYFKRMAMTPRVVTVSHIEPPHFLNHEVGVVAPCQVAIVGSSNKFNVAAIWHCLDIIARRLENNTSPPFILHIIGDVGNDLPKRWRSNKPWLVLHGFVTELSLMYQKMDVILAPMTCGTGINIKTVEAMAHGMPLLATRVAMRGIVTDEPMHHYRDIITLIDGLFALCQQPDEIIRLAAISRQSYLAFYKKNLTALRTLFV